jgi:hypothetical protein
MSAEMQLGNLTGALGHTKGGEAYSPRGERIIGQVFWAGTGDNIYAP